MIPSPMTLEFKFPVIFQNVAMIEALQSCDFVVDVTLAIWTFDGNCFSVPFRPGGLENSRTFLHRENNSSFLHRNRLAVVRRRSQQTHNHRLRQILMKPLNATLWFCLSLHCCTVEDELNKIGCYYYCAV